MRLDTLRFSNLERQKVQHPIFKIKVCNINYCALTAFEVCQVLLRKKFEDLRLDEADRGH